MLVQDLKPNRRLCVFFVENQKQLWQGLSRTWHKGWGFLSWCFLEVTPPPQLIAPKGSVDHLLKTPGHDETFLAAPCWLTAPLGCVIVYSATLGSQYNITRWEVQHRFWQTVEWIYEEQPIVLVSQIFDYKFETIKYNCWFKFFAFFLLGSLFLGFMSLGRAENRIIRVRREL